MFLIDILEENPQETFDKLKKELEVSLAISLHAVRDEIRNELVPINKKWPIK